jgi:hypothetical protein
VEEDKEVVAELLQTLAELTSAPSPKLLVPDERKRHIDEGPCFKCHKKGHRLFKFPELKGKEAMDAPSKKQ